jgi:hypothetical protein
LDPVDAINEAVALHAGWVEEARRKGNADGTARRWARRMKALQDAAKELQTLRALHRPVAGDLRDLADLPPALLAQLSGPKTDGLEEQILSVVGAAKGGIELNRLLIELYRRYGDVHERKALNNKAYRMVRKGLLLQVIGRRGV